MNDKLGKIELTARTIEKQVASGAGCRLPPLSELARMHGVALVTAQKAVRVLCKKGLLDARPGQGIVVRRAGCTPSVDKIDTVADRIEADLRKHMRDPSVLRIPSLAKLAVYHQTSLSTVRRAVGRLRADGLVVVSARRRPEVIANMPQPASKTVLFPLSSDEMLYGLLRSRIESGVYRAGSPLPKVAYLTHEESVATHSVMRVCRRLVQDGLAYRRGRSLIAGRAAQAHEMGVVREGRCVMIVQTRETAWKELSFPWWTLPFVQSFLREMSLHGLEPKPAIMDICRPGAPDTRQSLAYLVRQLGNRLLGIIVDDHGWTSTDPDALRRTLDDMRLLCKLGKPVVSFDGLVQIFKPNVSIESEAIINRSMAAPEMKRFVRCYIDGGDSVRLALSTLQGLGHRVVGYPTVGKSFAWMRFRRNDLRDAQAALGESMRIVDAQECPPLFVIHPAAQLGEIGRTLRKIDAPFVDKVTALVVRMGSPATPFASLSDDQKEMVLLTSHLGPFVLFPGLTAVIAPNDKHARQFFRWFTAAGIQIPQDLSLVSFDDRQEVTWPHAISSVNFGFDSLGYTAFHALLGDVPVKTDRWRSVSAKSRLNHSATIGLATPVRPTGRAS